ncbi:hypothetical protein CEXT_335991 [Caerostris extrusa]|uniref:Uncharacterized protein n=1 Tax=Caerostris extrusa TaxID=172846 RepID=A0AAV4TW36_CAEEX|nr:hypothetical protein CEXT_335991 [Caerostris extrusa]
MLTPNISDSEEDGELQEDSNIATEEAKHFSASSNEKVTVSPTETNPPFVPSTRKPQRRPVLSRPVSSTPNKNPVNRVKPQTANNKIRPKPQVAPSSQNKPFPHANTDIKRPSYSQSFSSQKTSS